MWKDRITQPAYLAVQEFRVFLRQVRELTHNIGEQLVERFNRDQMRIHTTTARLFNKGDDSRAWCRPDKPK